MNKKIFGLNIGTILTAAACLLIAISIWVYVEFVNASDDLPRGEETCDVG